MSNRLIPILVAAIALFLGGAEARAALQRWPAVAPSRLGVEFSICATLAAWLANVAWVFRSGPWYWGALLVIGTAVLAGLAVSPRSVASWRGVRHLIAIATSASAGLLWAAYPPH